MANEKAPGLDGVIVAETRLSDVDGERGRLIIAGRDVEEIAGSISFEAAWSLLQDATAPDAARIEQLRARLGAARVRAHALLPSLGNALEADDGMDALRAALSHCVPSDDATTIESLIGATAVFAAAWSRTHRSLPIVAPDPARSHAADYLRLMHDAEPSPAAVAGMDAYLVAVIDHGMNASTFAARVVASTGSDLVSSIVAAIGALKGPLHGGAPGPVLDMLDAIGDAENAEPWLERELLAGRRIMGMGHRIYRVRDPRAAVLEAAVLRLEQAGGTHGTPRLALARAVEKAATGILRARHPQRPLAANVEFYTAILLDALGLPRAAFTPTFAASRVAGWCAHVLEQRAGGRLIRPASRYVGFVPQSAA
jgi:citrate synthase